MDRHVFGGDVLQGAAHQGRVVGVLDILAQQRERGVVDLLGEDLQHAPGFHLENDLVVLGVAHHFSLRRYLFRVSITATSVASPTPSLLRSSPSLVQSFSSQSASASCTISVTDC